MRPTQFWLWGTGQQLQQHTSHALSALMEMILRQRNGAEANSCNARRSAMQERQCRNSFALIGMNWTRP